MIKQNLHTHTSFGDGRDSPEEMVLAAIEKGFTSIGFSEHAYTPYDYECCIKREDVPVYFAEIDRLKQKYMGRLGIFVGFECDAHYNTPRDGLDFTIGSAHYVITEDTGEYITIDYLPERFEKAVREAADGSVERLVEMYYNELVRFALEYRPDIVGHMDLIKKLNGFGRYFDPESAWYKRVVDEAAEKIAAADCVVEVNTGGIFRGSQKEPYPSPGILSRLFELRVPVTISSDAHSADALDFWFDEAVKLLKKTGYRSIKQLTADGFVDVEL